MCIHEASVDLCSEYVVLTDQFRMVCSVAGSSWQDES
jgi:hypothetical protein